MKKAVLLVAAVFALVLVLAPTAFAGTYTTWGNTTNPWDPNYGESSPHGGYGLTTEKCAVCHAVHAAGSVTTNSAGVVTSSDWGIGVGSPTAVPPTGSIPQSQVLLRTTVADSCSYCHVYSSLGGIALYRGSYQVYNYAAGNSTASAPASVTIDPAVVAEVTAAKVAQDVWQSGGGFIRYSWSTSTSSGQTVGLKARLYLPDTPWVGYNPSTGLQITSGYDAFGALSGSGGYSHKGSSGCVKCHSVHGANVLRGAVEDKILKDWNTGWDGRSYQSTVNFTSTIAASSDRNLQVTGFCTGCHTNYFTSPDQVYSSTNSSGSTTKKQGHAMKDPGATFDSTSAAGASTVSSPVSFASSTYCTSCHRAGQIYVDGRVSTVTPPIPGYTGASGPSGGFYYNGSNTVSATGVYSGTPLTAYRNSFPHNNPDNVFFLTAAPSVTGVETGVANGMQGEDGVCLRCHNKGDGISGVGYSF